MFICARTRHGMIRLVTTRDKDSGGSLSQAHQEAMKKVGFKPMTDDGCTVLFGYGDHQTSSPCGTNVCNSRSNCHLLN